MACLLLAGLVCDAFLAVPSRAPRSAQRRTVVALSGKAEGGKAEVLFVVPQGDAPSPFGGTSPQPSPSWHVVAQHISERMPQFDDRITASVLTAESLESQGSPTSADLVIALGLTADAAVPLEVHVQNALVVLSHRCADEVTALQRVAAYKPAATGVEAAAQTLATRLIPWGAAAQGMRLADQAIPTPCHPHATPSPRRTIPTPHPPDAMPSPTPCHPYAIPSPHHALPTPRPPHVTPSSPRVIPHRNPHTPHPVPSHPPCHPSLYLPSPSLSSLSFRRICSSLDIPLKISSTRSALAIPAPLPYLSFHASPSMPPLPCLPFYASLRSVSPPISLDTCRTPSRIFPSPLQSLVPLGPLSLPQPPPISPAQIFFALHANVIELDIVRHTVNPTWEKGPLRNAQARSHPDRPDPIPTGPIPS